MTSISATIPAEAQLARPLRERERERERDRVHSARATRRAEDRTLVMAALRGDEDSFRRLVERYQRPLFWVAHDVLLDAEEARDVVQETFIRIYAALASFDLTRDFQNWVYRIARNLAIDAYRRRRRRERPVDDAVLAASDAGEEGAQRVGSGRTDGQGLGVVAEAELSDQVSRVLACLPVEYRVALTLREFHGMTPREIAEVTDCSYPTARWRLHRARALFRKAWEQRYGEPALGGGMA